MAIVENSEWYLENRRRRMQRWRITTLVAVHVFASGFLPFRNGISAAVGSEYCSAMIQLSLFHCQVGLLGIWGGLGTNRWPWRLLGFGVAMTYLSGLVAISLQPYFAGPGMPDDFVEFSTVIVTVVVTVVVVPTILVALMLLIVRRTFIQLRVDRENGAVESASRIQFSIRHLMLVTLLVGITMPVGMGIWRYLDFNHRGLATSGMIVILAWTSTWAALGKRTPYIPSLIALGIAAFIGLGFDYTVGNLSFLRSTMETVFTCVFSLASLFVVRSCGYRLVHNKYVIAATQK